MQNSNLTKDEGKLLDFPVTSSTAEADKDSELKVRFTF